MKFYYFILGIMLITSCVSTQKVAEYRNQELSTSNYFENFKFWRDLDIHRFRNNQLNVKIGIIPENIPISEIKDRPYLQTVYDSIKIQIEERNESYQNFTQEYFDTTDQERIRIFKRLKSDSTDILLLSNLVDDPYFLLYEDLTQRTVSVLQKTTFYSSQSNFESYIQKRSFSVCTQQELNQIFGSGPLSIENISDNHWSRLKERKINFLIFFSVDFAVDYSEEARDHIGSEKIVTKLLDIDSGRIISSAEVFHFWGKVTENQKHVNEAS